MADNKKIDDAQIGFNKGSRTSDHMFTLKAIIDKYNKRHKKLYACFIDFKKAFDTVDHTGLLYKLKQCGIGDSMYNLIKTMYTSEKANLSIKVGNKLTSKFKSLVGVKQGDPLSPTLFKIYINDILNYFDASCSPVNISGTPTNCLLYADDLIFLSESKEGLQNCMKKLANFCKDWGLEVNTTKTKSLIFSSSGKREHIEIDFSGSAIENVLQYKYLGIMFSSSGKFTAAKEDLYKRGLKATFKLSNLLKSNNIGYKTSMHLFDHIVKPVLLYGSEIWGPLDSTNKTTDKLIQHSMNSLTEKCHLKFCRIMLGVGRKAPNLGIYGETGRLPLLIDIFKAATKFYIRLLTLENNCMLYRAFTDNKALMEHNISCWTKSFTDF